MKNREESLGSKLGVQGKFYLMHCKSLGSNFVMEETITYSTVVVENVECIGPKKIT